MGVKVLTVIGTRPEAIKLFPVVHALDADPRFESLVCVTGQHREMVDEVLALADVRRDFDLQITRVGDELDALVVGLLKPMGAVLDAAEPDWVIVQGDTTSAVCGALAAYHRHIPICHVEAGLRSGDLSRPWPEEGNRRLITALAGIHCAPTHQSRVALQKENIDPATIHVTGNPGVDALRWVISRTGDPVPSDSILMNMKLQCKGRRIVVVTAHRRESFGAGMHAIAEAVRRLAARDDIALVFPVHRNPSVRAIMRAELSAIANVVLIEPLDYASFARLMSMAYLILTDSGGVQEEAPTLGKPVLVMRDTTERTESIVAGTAKLVGANADRIVAAAEALLDDAQTYSAMSRAHNPYGDGEAARRIVNLLASS